MPRESQDILVAAEAARSLQVILSNVRSTKNPAHGEVLLFEYFIPAITYFPMGASPIVSSALPRFTSLFGMGRGGATASNHRNKIFNMIESSYAHTSFFTGVRSISTPRLNTLLCLHLEPINLVVFEGSNIPHLGVGFPLRCFQRLSVPDIATQRCSWRNSW